MCIICIMMCPTLYIAFLTFFKFLAPHLPSATNYFEKIRLPRAFTLSLMYSLKKYSEQTKLQLL